MANENDQPVALDFFEELTVRSTTTPNGSAKEAIYRDFVNFVVAKGLPTGYEKTALGLFLHTLAMNSTSVKDEIANDGGVFLSFKVEGKPFQLTNKDVLEFLKGPTLLFHVNKARTFGRTFQNEYIEYYKMHSDRLPPIPRGIKHGLPTEDNFLAADYLDNPKGLSELQQARLAQCRGHALQSTELVQADITSLSQLGRRPL
ncbi:MAG: major coat protein [Plant associated closterovirus 1]|nr:MAG: major coat protein [Plant associated closterovirus 1]